MDLTTSALSNLFLFQYRALRLLMEAQVLLAVQKFISVFGCQLSKDAIIHQLKI